ncbi:hypothetical protein SAVIM40S_07819 [Streptomyces avidinii]|uniref:Alcohol dehydrogenase-like protein n=1 Tax=Streptomyces avidinii TaxID=1895 RepID=A0ABS4KZ65_STRAV|nr:hypothetical protein [Streptomyces avidinii]
MGIVEEVGPDVTSPKPGDRVVIPFAPGRRGAAESGHASNQSLHEPYAGSSLLESPIRLVIFALFVVAGRHVAGRHLIASPERGTGCPDSTRSSPPDGLQPLTLGEYLMFRDFAP